MKTKRPTEAEARRFFRTMRRATAKLISSTEVGTLRFTWRDRVMRATLIATVLVVMTAGCDRGPLQPQQWETIVDTSDVESPNSPSEPSAPVEPAKAEQPEADVITGRVVRVIDGDTLVVLVDKEQIKVRLEGIDCPESGQPYGTKAKQGLSELVFSKDVRIKSSGEDRYGRTLGRVFVDVGRTETDSDIQAEIDVSQFLVARGLAWHYKRYSDDKQLAQAEEASRREKRGLWADAKPVPPWEWRDRQPPPAKDLLADVPVVPNGVEIAAMLPNPNGTDEGNEQVMISNGTDKDVDLDGWKMLDQAGNRYQLSGRVQAGRGVTITLDPPTMPLNNNGDSILLFDADGVPVCRVTYSEKQVRAGEWIEFGGRKTK